MAAPGTIDVVFVHGLFSNRKTWDTFQRLIADDADLASTVRLHFFEYNSPYFLLRVDRRIAEVDDIADQLQTYLGTRLRDAESIVLVTHSQGGLVVQRCLARTIWRGKARELARIKRVVMFACPNDGSEFFLSVRRFAFWWRNPQERQLRPFNKAVREAQETVLRAVVNALGQSDTECRIPIDACGGTTDRIVPPETSNWVFPSRHVVEGDHFSVIRPVDRDAPAYHLVKQALMATGNAPESRPCVPQDLSTASTDRQDRVSVAPPYGRRGTTLRGRTALISAITSPPDRARVHVLAGLGGSGKSRLALEIAHLAKNSGRRVWWVSVTQINSSMREVANQLGAPDSQVDRAWLGAGSATDLAWRYLNACPDPWLLVFDNADDPQRLAPLGGQVSDGTGWLREPSTPHGMVIVTSRDQSEEVWGPWSTVHLVPPLKEEDGALLLMERTGNKGGTLAQARALSAELGGLPLALLAAADYVKSVSDTKVWVGDTDIRTFEDYRREIKRRFESPPGEQSDLDDLLGLEIVRSVLELSLELLGSRGMPQAAPLLKVFACLNIAPIPYRLLLHSEELATSPLFADFNGFDDFNDFTATRRITVMNALSDLSLVEPYRVESATGPEVAHVVTLHPLVHGILRADRDVKARRSDYYGLNVLMLLETTRDSDPDYAENWMIWGAVAPHSIEVARTSLIGSAHPVDQGVIAEALELARLTSRYLVVTGLLGPAHDLVVPIIANCETFGFGKNDLEILGLRHEKARIDLERGDPMAAEEELRQVITHRTALLGFDHAVTLASRHKLAKAILEQGRWAEAETELRSIVEAEKQVRGERHADTLIVRHSLCRAILAQDRRAAEAEEMLREILEVRNATWPPGTPETLFVRQTLARSLLEQGDVKAAEEEILGALHDTGGRLDSPIAMNLRHTLVTVLLMKGRTRQAKAELSALLDDRKRVLGPAHPETRRTAELLARTTSSLVDEDDAA
jgi:pimeloyl-ACP methyl ester carboxylesterase